MLNKNRHLWRFFSLGDGVDGVVKSRCKDEIVPVLFPNCSRNSRMHPAVPVLVLFPPVDIYLHLWKISSMSLTLSHPLHQQLLRFSQVAAHRFKIWQAQRQVAYDLRDRNESEFHAKAASAHSSGDDVLVLAVEKQRVQAYQKIKIVIDRFNWDCSAEIRDAQYSDVALHRRQSFLSEKLALISTSEVANPAKIFAALAFAVVKVFLPPGSAIRSTPRRPGAPSASLPH
jgi:hypothetical protein